MHTQIAAKKKKWLAACPHLPVNPLTYLIDLLASSKTFKGFLTCMQERDLKREIEKRKKKNQIRLGTSKGINQLKSVLLLPSPPPPPPSHFMAHCPDHHHQLRGLSQRLFPLRRHAMRRVQPLMYVAYDCSEFSGGSVTYLFASSQKSQVMTQ